MNKPTLEYVETLIRNGVIRKIDNITADFGERGFCVVSVGDAASKIYSELAAEQLEIIEELRAFFLDPAAVTRAAEKILEAWK